MAQELLRNRLAAELPPINTAIADALAQLPPSCVPVANHVIAAGGKRLRPFLAVMCARVSGLSGDSIYPLAACMELLHAATLLHDDILDQADTRRGRSAAHHLFGIHDTILAGDALLALGNYLLADTGRAPLARCYAQATMATAQGEIQEMASLRRLDFHEEQFLAVVRGKTACLMGHSCALGALVAEAPLTLAQALYDYGEHLGMGFQLVDDALDFAPCQQTGKPRGGDLREGKLTLPIRLYRNSLSPAAQDSFDAAFAAGQFEESALELLADAIAPFAQASLLRARDFLQRAVEALKVLPESQERDILCQLATYVAERHS